MPVVLRLLQSSTCWVYMVHTCTAAGCSNRSNRDKAVNLKYHRFPRDPKLRKIWLRRIGRSPNLNLSDWNSARVCSKHFPDCVRTGEKDCLPLVRSLGWYDLTSESQERNVADEFCSDVLPTLSISIQVLPLQVSTCYSLFWKWFSLQRSRQYPRVIMPRYTHIIQLLNVWLLEACVIESIVLYFLAYFSGSFWIFFMGFP